MKKRTIHQVFAVLLLAGLCSAALAGAQKSAAADVQLQAAIHKQTVEGDLEQAIRMYKDIVSKYSANHAVAASALLHMGQAYEKLGSAEARKAYERIANEFADQKDVANEAKVRLAALRPTSGSTSIAGILIQEVPQPALLNVTESKVSRDGHYMLVHNSSIAVLRDLMSGSDRELGESFDSASFSVDGKRLVGFVRESGNYFLHFVNLQGPGVSPPKRLLANSADIESIVAQDWTRDGQSIVVSLQRKDHSAQIGLVSVADGSLRILETTDWRGPSHIFVSPDGKQLAFDLPATSESAQRDIFVMALDASVKTPVVVDPADDAVMGWSPDGKYLIFGSDRTPGSPSLWVLPMSDGKAQGAAKMVQRDIGSAETMGVTESGALYFNLPPVRRVRLRIGSIELNTERLSSPVEIPLQTDASRGWLPMVSWSADGRRLAFLTDGSRLNGARQPILSIRSRDGVEARELHPSSLGYIGSWSWYPDGRSFLIGGEDFKGQCGIYRVDAQIGATVPIVTDGVECFGGFGLPTASPDGRTMYYWRGNKALIARDFVTGSERELFQGSPAPGYQPSPDGRYIAVTSGSVVRLIPTAGGQSRELMNGGFAGWAQDSQSILVVSGRSVSTGRPVQQDLWRVSLDGQSRKINIEIANLSPNLRPASPIIPDGYFANLAVDNPGGSGGNFRVIENFLPAPAGSTTNTASSSRSVAQLTWSDRTGKQRERIGSVLQALGPDLSRDGKRVVIHGHDGAGGDIWILDSKSGNTLSRLTTDKDSTQHNSMPVWSPDGSQIIFRSRRNGKWGLYTKHADGSGSEELLVDSVSDIPVSWSPDGKFIVYGVYTPATGDDLWVLPLTGDRKPFPIVQTVFNEKWPQISPDGKWLAYSSDKKGPFQTHQIFVQPFLNGTGEWQVSTGSGIDPHWRADGKELYFLAGSAIMASEFRVTGGAVQPGAPRELFRFNSSFPFDTGGQHHSFAVSPDGQRFLLSMPTP